jgi:hypothetical protein
MFSIVNSSLRRQMTVAAVAVAPANNSIVIAGHQQQWHRSVRNLSSTNIQSRDKLTAILEEYRRTNFPEELPQRVWKDITKAATKNNRQQQRVVLVKPLPPSLPFVAVSAEGIENVLHNIGFGHRMSREEIDELVSEVGGDMTIPSTNGERQSIMSATQLFDLISRECCPHNIHSRASVGGVVSSINTTQMAYASSFMMVSSIESSKTSSYVALA